MGRLIDADAIIQAVCTKLGIKDKKFLLQSEKAIVDVILNAPTVDAVEVVRCKDCMFSKVYQNDSSGVMGRFCEAFTQVRMVTDDDYCSYGERKEDRP